MQKSANYEYLLDTRLKRVIAKTWETVPTRREALYNIQPSDKAIEYDYTMGDIGLATRFDETGQVNYQDMSGQYRTSYEAEEIVTGMRIQRKLIDDDQYAVIDKMAGRLSRSMKLTQEDDAVSVFSNAFSSSYTGSDSVALCSSSHPAVGTSTVQSNTSTYEFTLARLKTVRLAMMKFNTDKNNRIGVIPDTLILPVDLAQTAAEMTGSELVPYEMSNTVNYNKGRYKIIDWMYMIDTNNWFVVDSSRMKTFLMWYVRKDAEFNRDKDSDTYVTKHSAYMRYSNGFSGWDWISGNNAS